MILKDFLYGELSACKRKKGRQHLRFVDTCEGDMKACDIDTNTWESQGTDRCEKKIQIISHRRKETMPTKGCKETQEESQPTDGSRPAHRCTSFHMQGLQPTMQIKNQSFQQ